MADRITCECPSSCGGYTCRNLDEIVRTDVKSFHLERMSGGHVWIGLEMNNGELLHINMTTRDNKRAKIQAVVYGAL